MSFPYKNWDKKNMPLITIPISRFKQMIYMSIAIGIGLGGLVIYYLGVGC